MPIAGYISLCKERASIISSRDKGGPMSILWTKKVEILC